jgi:hypothetical protein
MLSDGMLWTADNTNKIILGNRGARDSSTNGTLSIIGPDQSEITFQRYIASTSGELSDGHASLELNAKDILINSTNGSLMIQAINGDIVITPSTNGKIRLNGDVEYTGSLSKVTSGDIIGS